MKMKCVDFCMIIILLLFLFLFIKMQNTVKNHTHNQQYVLMLRH